MLCETKMFEPANKDEVINNHLTRTECRRITDEFIEYKQ